MSPHVCAQDTPTHVHMKTQDLHIYPRACVCPDPHTHSTHTHAHVFQIHTHACTDTQRKGTCEHMYTCINTSAHMPTQPHAHVCTCRDTHMPTRVCTGSNTCEQAFISWKDCNPRAMQTPPRLQRTVRTPIRDPGGQAAPTRGLAPQQENFSWFGFYERPPLP